jgi:hypothetical protein
MKSLLAVVLALSPVAVIAAENPKECNVTLSRGNLSKEVGGVTNVKVTKNLCVDAKQFSSIAMAQLENWKITRVSDKFWMMEPLTALSSMVVLFEPGQKTGHAVLILPNPNLTSN